MTVQNPGSTLVKKYRLKDDWSHPVVDWAQALKRLHKLARYLLNTAPLPLSATLFLVPHGRDVAYRVTRTDKQAVPLEFLFWYPTSTATGRQVSAQQQFQALVAASGRLMYEFQHVELAAGVSEAPSGKVENTVKDEANSYCWKLSSLIVLTYGTHSEITVPNMNQRFTSLRVQWGQFPTYRTAVFWAKALVTRDLRHYLNDRGFPATFTVRNIRIDNAVFGFCRALTLHNWDITVKTILPKEIVYSPFLRRKT